MVLPVLKYGHQKIHQRAGVERKLVFSGDIGNVHKPITKDPATVADADYVVMESTYGNRSHNGTPDYVLSLSKYSSVHLIEAVMLLYHHLRLEEHRSF